MYMFVYVCVYVQMSTEATGTDPFAAGVTCCCELPDVGTGN